MPDMWPGSVVKRLLVTGSRRWPDPVRVADTLRDAHAVLAGTGFAHSVTLVHGDCPTGADRMARDAWPKPLPIEPHKAEWDIHGKAAGPLRNGLMVGLGADLCVAFLTPDSVGGLMTARLAEAQGITTWRVEL